MGVYHAHINDDFGLGWAAHQITQLGGTVTAKLGSDLETAKIIFEGSSIVSDYIRNLPCVVEVVPQSDP